jgi:hypothetical protein
MIMLEYHSEELKREGFKIRFVGQSLLYAER